MEDFIQCRLILYTPPISDPYPPIPSVVFFFFYRPLCSVCSAHILIYKGPLLEHGQPPPLKKTVSPCLRSHQLSLSPQLGVESCELLSAPCWSVYWLDLIQVVCRWPYLLWVHVHSGSAVFRDTVLFLSSQPLAHNVFLLPFLRRFLSLTGEGEPYILCE